MYQAIPKETICVRMEQEGQIAATGLGILDREFIGIYAIHVREDLRGQGIGRALCTTLLAEGTRRGATQAYLQCVEGNLAAESLYRSLGFEHLYTYWFRVQKD